MATLALNRAARYHYHCFEEIEAGLVLLGSEVKSILAGQAQLVGSYLWITNASEIFLYNCLINPLNNQGDLGHKSDRVKKVLLHKKQIIKLALQCKREGILLVALSIYQSRGHLKLKIALGKPMKKIDKREKIKQKDFQRKINKIF